MNSVEVSAGCCLCEHPATVALDPPRRTLARGADPTDSSYSVTAILPDVPLCSEHSLDVQQGAVLIGWCDDERCRAYGEIGELSDCGSPFTKLGPGRRS